ncbi:MAG: shikimate dehydrogenase [Nanoarchaeota archaeon]|nr:shikimate dehydrogenase [Nanoarchaeota archaeon]
MIAIPIIASTTNEALKDMRKCSKLADIIELRLDYIKKPNLKLLLAKAPKPVIVTVRKKNEGGKLKIDEKNRIDLLKKAIDLKANFIDVEISTKSLKELIKKAKKSKTKVIVSYHNFKKTNKKEIIDKYNKIKKLNPDIIKIVTHANSIDDNIPILDLIKKAKKENKKIIALCMGEKGEISRILSSLSGAYLTFASFNGKGSAPGQLDAKTLIDIYGVNKLKNPKVFGLVGNPVSHSKGYIFHNNIFKKSKLNKIYLNFLVDDLKSFIKNYKKIISGLSITIPFKREIVKYLNTLDSTTKKIGAVNTVIKSNGKLIGYNTDVAGAISTIESKTKIKNKKVLMIGAGGVARAIGYGIIQKKGSLTILNRTVSKARRLAKELRCNHGNISRLKNQKNIDIIINSTSIGMTPKVNKTPIRKEILKRIAAKKTLVFDSIYTPKNTKLLKEAKDLRLNILSGYGMFFNQAKEQSKLFERGK